jgi:uncharacterized membrane protein YfcA
MAYWGLLVADTILVLCVVLSAYFVRGITGFGSGLIAVPLLALSHPLTLVVPLVLALDFTASLVLGGVNRRNADWKEVGRLLPFGIAGACIGVFALLKLPAAPVLCALGVYTMFFGFRNIFGLASDAKVSGAWAAPAGIVGGSVGALFGASGPPYIIYLRRRLQDQSTVRATFSSLFVIDGGFRLAVFLAVGLLLDAQFQHLYALSLVPLAIGLYSGNKVHLDITSEAMLKVVGGLLVISGALLFVKVVL